MGSGGAPTPDCPAAGASLMTEFCDLVSDRATTPSGEKREKGRPRVGVGVGVQAAIFTLPPSSEGAAAAASGSGAAPDWALRAPRATSDHLVEQSVLKRVRRFLLPFDAGVNQCREELLKDHGRDVLGPRVVRRLAHRGLELCHFRIEIRTTRPPVAVFLELVLGIVERRGEGPADTHSLFFIQLSWFSHILLMFSPPLVESVVGDEGGRARRVWPVSGLGISFLFSFFFFCPLFHFFHFFFSPFLSLILVLFLSIFLPLFSRSLLSLLCTFASILNCACQCALFL
ncbi:hypothetical protein GGR56DRAFT_647590 [Xylariaceae sp. FL0804]|nr:hypothetical protein GGR56DRAFT_647590 [Xylariaceae sp. FL0804]